MPLYVANLLHETIPTPGISDTVFDLLADTSVRPAATLTVDPTTDQVLAFILGADCMYTLDGTTPSATAGYYLGSGSQLWLNPSSFSTLRIFPVGGAATLRVGQFQYHANSYRRASGLANLTTTRTFKDVYHRVLRQFRHDPATFDADNTTNPALREAVAGYIENRVHSLWRFRMWPDLESIVEADVETDGSRHFVSLEGGDIANPGEILAVYLADPLVHPAQPPETMLLREGAIFLPDATDTTATVWVRVRPRPPRFTRTTEYASGTTYSAGAVVYWPTTGECYMALTGTTGNAPSNTAYWERQLVPEWMIVAVIYGAASDWAAYDGQSAELTSRWEARFREERTAILDARLSQQDADVSARW